MKLEKGRNKMLSAIQTSIKELTQKHPSWDRDVADFFEHGTTQDTNPDEEMLDNFTDLLSQIIEFAKSGELSSETAISLFDDYACKGYASKYIKLKLRTYNSYKALRELASTDIYKAKYCVDLIWSSYILRFNPHLVFDENVPLKEEEFKNVAVQLDRFTDFCIDRGYHISAIMFELKSDANFSDPLCEYIAEKIDSDFEKLKLNYIIHRISLCERAIDELSEK